jgi:putative flavoprotein involved in K+ transport
VGDELGFPIQKDGASTVIPGLYFVGVHFLGKRKSSLLIGVGDDAAILARRLLARARAAEARSALQARCRCHLAI